MQIHVFKTVAEAANALATEVTANIHDAQQDHGSASLALSGGSTPSTFLQTLAKQQINWSAVKITTTDERQVSIDNERSNARLIKETLIDHVQQPVEFVWMYNTEMYESENTFGLNTDIKDLLPLDVCLLGMGLDGHTASLFPGVPPELLSEDYEKDLETVVPSNGLEPRATLTVPSIVNAESVYLLIHGVDKRVVFEKACAGEDELEMPVRTIIRHAGDKLKVYSVES